MDKLYFVTRTDLSEGRRMAQCIHAMDLWTAKYGYQGGTVIVYAVPNEKKLMDRLPDEGKTVVFREPDLNNEATAFATDQGPFRLPLLGGSRSKSQEERKAA